MRLSLLIPAAASLAFLLPLSAHAEWTDQAKQQFMQNCEKTAAGPQVAAKKAQTHCECAAGVVEKNYSAEQLAAIDKEGANSEKAEDLKAKVAAACGAQSK